MSDQYQAENPRKPEPSWGSALIHILAGFCLYIAGQILLADLRSPAALIGIDILWVTLSAALVIRSAQTDRPATPVVILIYCGTYTLIIQMGIGPLNIHIPSTASIDLAVLQFTTTALILDGGCTIAYRIHAQHLARLREKAWEQGYRHGLEIARQREQTSKKT